VNNGAVTVTGRSMPTVEGLRNLRDLAGLPTEDGGSIRSGCLFRSEAPLRLTPTGQEQLVELGIRTVIDLREAGECASAATSFPSNMTRIAVELPQASDPGGNHLLDLVLNGKVTEYSAADLGELYVDYLEHHAPTFGRAIELIGEPGRLPALVHCTAGKDRTGLVVALTLAVVGVSPAEIVADYEITSQCRAYRLVELAPAFEKVGVSADAVASLFAAPAQALRMALDHIDRKYGSANDYLRDKAGVDPATLVALRDQLVDDVPTADRSG
jgi:protein-tyrosine phosphatase